MYVFIYFPVSCRPVSVTFTRVLLLILPHSIFACVCLCIYIVLYFLYTLMNILFIYLYIDEFKLIKICPCESIYTHMVTYLYQLLFFFCFFLYIIVQILSS